MNRIWLAATFAAGIATGLLLARVWQEPPRVEVAAAPVEKAPPAVGSVNSEAPPAPRPATAETVRRALPEIAPAVRQPEAGAAAEPAPDDSQATQPIDVGPVFRAQFESAATGYKDHMLEAHQALEREPRDDNWAYAREAEIENSLVADTSMGNFVKEHLECRRTMCELRLSGKGKEQQQAIHQWQQNVINKPTSSQLYPFTSSISSNNDVVDALIIYSKPPKDMRPPQN